MSKDLEDKIEQLEERIEELEQALDESCDSDELANHEGYGYDRAMLEIESKIEHAFNAGFNDKYIYGTLPDSDLELTKAYLNYKMEQRL